jgi:hypothetical protein
MIRIGRVVHIFPVAFKGFTDLNLVHPLDKYRIVIDIPYLWNSRLFSDILRKCEAYCDQIDASGFIEFEFILSGKKCFFLEVNARYSGLTRALFMASGINPYSRHLEIFFSSQPNKNDRSFIHCESVVVEVPLLIDVQPGFYGDVFIQPSNNRMHSKGRIISSGSCIHIAVKNIALSTGYTVDNRIMNNLVSQMEYIRNVTSR